MIEKEEFVTIESWESTHSDMIRIATIFNRKHLEIPLSNYYLKKNGEIVYLHLYAWYKNDYTEHESEFSDCLSLLNRYDVVVKSDLL